MDREDKEVIRKAVECAFEHLSKTRSNIKGLKLDSITISSD
jgi:hypothetical protein